MTCVWLPPGKAIQELTVKAALALEHGCTIVLVSQVRPDLTWKGAALGCDYQEDHWGQSWRLATAILETFHGKKILQDYPLALWICQIIEGLGAWSSKG